jgi:hypothetical protein
MTQARRVTNAFARANNTGKTRVRVIRIAIAAKRDGTVRHTGGHGTRDTEDAHPFLTNRATRLHQHVADGTRSISVRACSRVTNATLCFALAHASARHNEREHARGRPQSKHHFPSLSKDRAEVQHGRTRLAILFSRAIQNRIHSRDGNEVYADLRKGVHQSRVSLQVIVARYEVVDLPCHRRSAYHVVRGIAAAVTLSRGLYDAGDAPDPFDALADLFVRKPVSTHETWSAENVCDLVE